MPQNPRTRMAQTYILFYWVLFLMLTLLLTYSWRQAIYYWLSIKKFIWGSCTDKKLMCYCMAFQSPFVNTCSGTELEIVSEIPRITRKTIYYLSHGEPFRCATSVGWPAHCNICRDVSYSVRYMLWPMPNGGEGHLILTIWINSM